MDLAIDVDEVHPVATDLPGIKAFLLNHPFKVMTLLFICPQSDAVSGANGISVLSASVVEGRQIPQYDCVIFAFSSCMRGLHEVLSHSLLSRSTLDC